ncbi:MAG TPA: CopG family transcriptional regulator [Bdellovibrionales bacterium]|nr:MAG: hypothetical protein A2X97_08620 [Bdellovibrionales bacterium GWA1_52_35]HAR43439.1 CopG family transcriptional regulator [Bdellovibrionales bacterium]HCM41641.1 CopG family transcriptional regulator [Bdellovibrionales bacterium]
MKRKTSSPKSLNRDLSDYLSPEHFKPITFEFAPKDKSITIRISSELLKTVQGAAKKRKISYQKLIREAIEQFVRKAE